MVDKKSFSCYSVFVIESHATQCREQEMRRTVRDSCQEKISLDKVLELC